MKNQALILIVEDDDNDAKLINRAFTKAGIPNPCQYCRDGESALAYLQGQSPFADREKYPLPELVLLDLKLPGMDGFEVLRWIRSQHQFRSIRVVVTTVMNELRSVSRAYQLGANSFLAKPLEFESPSSLIMTLEGVQLLQPQPTERWPQTEPSSGAPV